MQFSITYGQHMEELSMSYAILFSIFDKKKPMDNLCRYTIGDKKQVFIF